MRTLMLTLTMLAVPVLAFGQSTVGSVPSNPNAMPAVNGSSAPKVATGKAKRKAASGKPASTQTTQQTASQPHN